MHFLDVLIPRQARPISIPCELPSNLLLHMFVPGVGIGTIQARISSPEPATASIAGVSDFIASGPGVSPAVQFSPVEHERAMNAAWSGLNRILRGLGLLMDSREPTRPPAPLEHIAQTFHAELEAAALGWKLVDELGALGIEGSSINEVTKRLPSAGPGMDTPAVAAMRLYLLALVVDARRASMQVATARQAARSHSTPSEPPLE